MTSKFVIESFWQQGANCVVLAYSKAMLLTYGLQNSFKKRKIGKGNLVILRDESSLFLSRKEIQKSNIGNRIYFRKYSNRKKARDIRKIKEFVELVFAILVQRLQLIGYNGKEFTRTHSKKALTKEGMTTERFHELIGIKKKPVHKLLKKDIQKIIRKKAVLLYHNNHIVCASRGRFNEDTGTAMITDKIPVLHGRKAKGWFELK